jgi:hypothetical protein
MFKVKGGLNQKSLGTPALGSRLNRLRKTTNSFMLVGIPNKIRKGTFRIQALSVTATSICCVLQGEFLTFHRQIYESIHYSSGADRVSSLKPN